MSQNLIDNYYRCMDIKSMYYLMRVVSKSKIIQVWSSWNQRLCTKFVAILQNSAVRSEKVTDNEARYVIVDSHELLCCLPFVCVFKPMK